jgi:hypothetical protein
VRLAANQTGKIAKSLYRGQTVDVLEVSEGWARISHYYDGVDEGLSGFVAQWVFAQHLSPVTVDAGQPAETPKPVAVKVDVDSPIFKAISSSDDLDKYAGLFVQVSEKLVESGQCDLSDFVDIGGWWRSNAHTPRSIYYTYCGGANNENRIFVDTATGRVFR